MGRIDKKMMSGDTTVRTIVISDTWGKPQGRGDMGLLSVHSGMGGEHRGHRGFCSNNDF